MMKRMSNPKVAFWQRFNNDRDLVCSHCWERAERDNKNSGIPFSSCPKCGYTMVNADQIKEDRNKK